MTHFGIPTPPGLASRGQWKNGVQATNDSVTMTRSSLTYSKAFISIATFLFKQLFGAYINDTKGMAYLFSWVIERDS